MKVKICGLTRLSDVKAAAAAGADSLGFISGYPDSPRNLNLEKLNELVSKVPPFVNSVVVTPNWNKDIGKIIRLAPSYIQLYGGLEHSRKVHYQNVIQTVRPTGNSLPTIRSATRLAKSGRAILFDASLTSRYSKKDGKHDGITLEESWETALAVKKAIGAIPLILSGGLTEKNVKRAVRYVRPYAVDVSSGVENSPGIKDAGKISRFVTNAKLE